MTTGALTILFVHNTADLYGASRSLLRLGARLRRDGHRVIAVLPGDGDLRTALEKAGVTVQLDGRLAVIDRTRFSPFGLLSLLIRIPLSAMRIAVLLRRFRVDLVHTNTALILSPGLAAFLCRVPHIWHIRECFSEFPAAWRLHRRWMAFFSSRIVAVSQAVAGQFARRSHGEKVLVIHNGFPREEFDGVTPERMEAFRARLGLGPGPAAGLVGRIKLRRKGQDVFVRAAALLKDRFPEARFLIIGSPFPGNEDHQRELDRMIEELDLTGRVICTGDVADIKAAYAALDFTVLAGALPEPFGGVVIESMAMGKPVAATEIGGTVEQIEDGVSGFIVPPDDPEALANAMARLLDDPAGRSRMGTEARQRFLERFEFQPFYQQMLGLYASVVKTKPGPVRECAPHALR